MLPKSLLAAGFLFLMDPLTRAASLPVTIPAEDNITLAATLELPANPDPAPALLLIAGSGPTDRDGNQPPTLLPDTLKQIADSLAAHGIATLRYDKRGMYANAKQLPKDPAQYADFFAWENFTQDAASAYNFLRTQPHIDPTRVAILGHSEGGLLALQALPLLKDHPPAALILISTPGRPVDQLLTDQIKHLLTVQHATADQTKYFLDQQSRITTAIRQTGQIPDDVPPGLAALYPAYLGKFLHSEFALDPPKALAAYPGPVLILQGASDVQVSPDLDTKALAAAAASRKNDTHTFTLIPNASHNLKILKNADDPAITGPLAPAALDAINNWLPAHLTAP